MKSRTKIPMVGKIFGEWVVVEQSENVGECVMWTCDCSCGARKAISGGSLRYGASKSCGCKNAEALSLRRRTHCKSGTSEFSAWGAMRGRCLRKTHKFYGDYGGRGISICDRWDKFQNFLDDMGPKPTPRHTLDRIDNNGNYEPGNCRWATQKVQSRNTRTNVYLTAFGETHCLMEWVERTGLGRGLIRSRIKRGWPVEMALSTPQGVTALPPVPDLAFHL